MVIYPDAKESGCVSVALDSSSMARKYLHTQKEEEKAEEEGE